MAFLSLGINIEEPQSPEASQKPPKELREDVVCDGRQGLVAEKEAQQRTQLSTDQAPHNGANGAVPRTDTAPIEAEKDTWPEMGMQIIQSVLRGVQTKESVRSSEPPSAEQISDLPSIEELRKKILEGIIPDFRTTPRNVQPPNGSSSATLSQADPAIKLGESSRPLSPDFLSSVMDDLRKHVGEDVLAPLNFRIDASAERVPPSMSALAAAPQPPATTIPDSLARALQDTRQHLAEPAPSSPSPSVARPGTLSTVAPTNRRKSNVIPTFTTFKFGYLPGRGLLYSIIGHEVLMFGLFLFITYGLPAFRGQTLIVGSQSAQSHLIYLPEVGGGKEGQKSPGGGRSKPQQASAAPARASKGLAFPGAQAILSDPPNPTNAFQTLLRPLIVHPEPLKKLVPLPNIVQMSETRLPASLMTTKAALPQPHLAVQPIKVKRDSDLRRNAKWNVPVAKAPELMAKAEMPKLPAAEQPLPEAPKVEPKKPEDLKKEEEKPVEKPAPQPLKVAAEKKSEKTEKQVAPPSTAQIAKMEMHGKAAEPMLSLSPMPLPAGSNAKIPAGEARGRFAIAPGGTLNPNTTTPGKANGTRSDSPATGQDNAQSANAATELAANTGNGAGHNPAAGGGSGNADEAAGGGSAGTGNGSGSTSGVGVGGAGTGNGRGSAGSGAGRSGHGTGTGAGAGSGAGSGAFPGITIQGGEGSSAASNSSRMSVTPQTPYQMTIVATASSGGGLQDFGVFENERVYTVYIPMQRTPQEADPTWTMQYALASGSSDSNNAQLVAPSPVMREWPEIPADLEKKYSQRQVVVYAMLGADGKISHISVKQTPDPHVSAPITQALGKWVFRPAQMNNQPVAVKILVGIPL
jgi:hypothetical protein